MSRKKTVLDKATTLPPGDLTKTAARAETAVLDKTLEGLFDLLNFAGQHALLIVLQGMDAAGKDGAIRHVLGMSHAQSCRVASFKVPTPEEARHDFLWRVHNETPGRGEIALFNRSHYEDVVVTRVHGLVSDEEAERRFGLINDFERLLVSADTIVVKLFLHVSKAEQEERLVEREHDPDAAWKLSVGDWQERALWDRYQRYYAEAIEACDRKHARWHVVPADKKWFRDLTITRILLDALAPYEDGWRAHLERVGRIAKEELAAYRAETGG